MKHYIPDRIEQDRIEAKSIWADLKSKKQVKLSEKDKKILDILFREMP